MRIRWITLAQAIALSACGSSHGLGDEDAGARDAGRAVDSGSALLDAGRDAGGPASSCDADDATSQICPDILCDGPGTWHWNGDRCFWIDCGACDGADCSSGFGSEDECAAAHRSCAPSLCRSTGGTWMWWAEECGHYECGVAPPQLCVVGMPVCDCGPFRRFDPAAGCFDDPECPIPEPATREELCLATGGAWEAICCDTDCGAYCPEPCVNMACNCGLLGQFVEGRGCVDSARCHERNLGETCHGAARCQPGAICCQQCGGAGCGGDPTCIAPVCDDDESFDECGNCLLCP